MAFPRRQSAANVRAGVSVYSRDQLYGSGGWRLVQTPEPDSIFLATSLPQFFMTDLPGHARRSRASARRGSYFPSNLAIDGLVRIDQLGASLWEVVHDWRGLWLLATVYFVLAVLSAHLVKQADKWLMAERVVSS